MPTLTIDQLKEQETAPTPLFLFDCVLRNRVWWNVGVRMRHPSAETLIRRALIKHNLNQLRSYSDAGLDGSAKVDVTLANADSHFSEIERATGFRGSQVTIQFLFYDLASTDCGVRESRDFSWHGKHG